MNPLLSSLLEIAHDAAVEIMEVYEQAFDVEYKAPEDPVTLADKRANTLICERLGRLYPDIPVVAEESPEEAWADFRKSRRVFFVDPVDGTREFVARNGEFVVMIGLLEDEVPTHGMLYAPALRTAWGGAVGEGAFKIAPDGTRSELQLTAPPELGRARVVSSRSHRSSLLEQAISHLGAQEVLPIGSAGLKGAALSDGRVDIYLAPEQAGCRWDSCAPEAIIRAAGGIYTDAYGRALDYRAASLKNDRGIVAAHPALHETVISKLREILPTKSGLVAGA